MNKYIIILLTGCIIGSASCVKLAKKFPDKTTYVLDTQRTAEPLTTIEGTTLKVRAFQAAAMCQDREFLYRKSQDRYATDYYNVFLIAPPLMITDETRNWLIASDLFDQVVNVSSRLDSTHVLEGNITRFYGDYVDPDNPKAVLEISLTLIDDQQLPPRTIIHEHYNEIIPLENGTRPDLVNGFTKALETILTRFEQAAAQSLTEAN